MDDILDCLTSFNVTGQPNSVHAEHPRFAQFKQKQSKSSQEERRKAVLAARKGARYDLLSHVRHVECGADDGSTEKTGEDAQDMEGVVECYQKPKRYQDFLMLSEWLVDVPEDFSNTYFAVPCPVGKRCLVVAANGQTSMYGRNGKCIERFYSVLPGGSPRSAHKGYAMFDCVVCYDDNVFYILDMVAWMNQSTMQCETSFRFEWIRSRLEENAYDTTVISDNNDYKFVAVKYYNCDKGSLQTMLEQPLSFEVELDGVLFYHKSSHYTHGQTPLVGWLKAYMMDEILGLTIPEQYLSQKPDKYENLSQHIEYGKQARELRLAKNEELSKEIKQQKKLDKNKNKQKSAVMDTEEATTSGSSGEDTVDGCPANDAPAAVAIT